MNQRSQQEGQIKKSKSDWKNTEIRVCLSKYQTEHQNLLIKNDEKHSTSDIQYSNDEFVEIKEEFIEDQDTTVQKYDSKFHAVDIKETYKVQESEQEAEKKYKCKKCSHSYLLKNHLNHHLKYECDLNPQFICKFCNRRFKQKCYMDRHISRVHENLDTSESVLRHKCNICFRSYTLLKNLNQHKRFKHSVVKALWFCDFCGISMNLKSSLARHIVSCHLQTTKIRHKCNKCPRSYTAMGVLNRHKRLYHETDKPQFICDFCGHKANEKASLSKHISSRHLQSSQIRHNCNVCSRSYTTTSALNQHKRAEHATVKPQFTCDYCCHNTNRKSSLSRHMIARHLNLKKRT
ncbi:zinc finger protein 678-like [Belonocnema kinseyi]|uniref:zinc finger protein 678-like n=1 Tax=Belonocnema kinseyi TaxID=2817044 RepID=UPI00143D8CE2|nr:zinc finger protein 678-like [Belonocnema kinseyi]